MKKGVIIGIIAVLLIGYIVIIKMCFPYYSDKRANYINKMRKNEKGTA